MTLSPACLLIALCSVFELSEEAEVAHQCVRLPGFCPQRKCVSMTAVRVKDRSLGTTRRVRARVHPHAHKQLSALRPMLRPRCPRRCRLADCSIYMCDADSSRLSHRSAAEWLVSRTKAM